MSESRLDAAEALCAEALRAVNDSIAETRQRIRELETYLADLDDATPSRRSHEELWSRVDTIAEWLREADHHGNLNPRRVLP